MFTGDIKISSPFKDLFPIQKDVLDRIVNNMKKNGYDKSRPIAIWMGHKSIVLDGHTRLQAAKLAKIRDVPVVLKEFPSEEAALAYTVRCQRNRRNAVEEILQDAVARMDGRKTGGTPGDEKLASSDAIFGKYSADVASLLGISACKLNRTMTILDKAPDAIRGAVMSGNMSIDAAYEKTIDWMKGKPVFLDNTKDEKLEDILEIVKMVLSSEEIRKLIKLLMEEI